MTNEQIRSNVVKNVNFLTKLPAHTFIPRNCCYLQNDCSNISTDGQLFAYMASGGSSDLIYYGSLVDGKPRQVAQLNSLYQAIVGWTVM